LFTVLLGEWGRCEADSGKRGRITPEERDKETEEPESEVFLQ